MTSEGARLKEQLRRVGEVKAASHAEATAAHLALPLGERLERAVRLSDSMLRVFRATAHMRPERVRDDDAETWARVYEKLHRHAR